MTGDAGAGAFSLFSLTTYIKNVTVNISEQEVLCT